jgi:hypothetical protein
MSDKAFLSNGAEPQKIISRSVENGTAYAAIAHRQA